MPPTGVGMPRPPMRPPLPVQLVVQPRRLGFAAGALLVAPPDLQSAGGRIISQPPRCWLYIQKMLEQFSE